MATYEITFVPGTAQTLSVPMAGVTYRLGLAWVDEPEGGWTLDITTEDGTPLVCGIPLLPGADLLAPYATLGIGVRLFVSTAGDPDAVPTFAGLGTASRLYFDDGA